jgi:hypothetical protein
VHGVTPTTRATRTSRKAKALAVAAAAIIPVFAGCSDSGSSDGGPQVPGTSTPAQSTSHGPFFPECGGVNDQEISKQTRVQGLVATAKTSVGCQWLSGGSILGPHFSFTWFRGSPIGRERKTEELSRTSVEDVNVEGHDGFIATGDDPTLGQNLCEIGIGFKDDFIEWSISFSQQPYPDPCDVAKELARQSIVNSK